jgi:hypothetical protein
MALLLPLQMLLLLCGSRLCLRWQKRRRLTRECMCDSLVK